MIDEFICKTCNTVASFCQLKDFIAHKATHLQEFCDDVIPSSSYVCQLCPQRFSRRSSLFMHYTLYHKVHGISKVNCCGEKFISGKKTAKRQNGRQMKFKSRDGRVTRTLSTIPIISQIVQQPALTDHVNAVEDQPVQTEPYTNHQSENEALCNDFHFMLQHQTINGASLTYLKTYLACVYCQYKCSQILELVTHMRDLHADVIFVPVEQQLVPNDKLPGILRVSEYLQQTNNMLTTHQSSPSKHTPQFKCEFCDKQFSNKTYLRRHRDQQHVKPKIYKCDLCDHGETTQHRLLAHRQKHLVKEFKCKECDFVSTVKVAIQSHRQIHNNGSHICDVCGKAYKMKDTLQKHKRVHDANRPFACTFTGCTLRFKTERMCRGHLKTHYVDGNNFPCNECGYSFRHKHHLKRHLENAHNVPFVQNQRRNLSSRVGEHTEIIDSANSAHTVFRKDTLVADSEAATVNISNIILADDSFDLNHPRNVEKQVLHHPVVALKSPGYSAESPTIYSQTAEFNSTSHTSIFIPEETDVPVGEKVVVERRESSHVLLDNVSYAFDDASDSVVEVEPNQVSATVEFIVETEESEHATFNTNQAAGEVTDPLFV